MSETQHPDEVERLRLALWGDRVGSDVAVSHVRACASCSADVERSRRTRDAFRRWAGAAVPEPVLRRAAETARSADDLGAAEVDWVLAVPLTGAAGVRGVTASDLHFLCDAGGYTVDIVLHRSGSPGRYALSGQALRSDASAAAGVDVTLYVDRRRRAEVTTDSFGEFAFDALPGTRYGLRVGGGDQAGHVEILPGGVR